MNENKPFIFIMTSVDCNIREVHELSSQSDDSENDGSFSNTSPSTSPPSISFSAISALCLIDSTETKEMKDIISEYPKLTKVFQSADDLLHALKVIACIKPHQRFGTTCGHICIQSDISSPNTWSEWWKYYLQPTWLMRMKDGEDRKTNLRIIKCIFIGALQVIETALQEREKMYSKNCFEKCKSDSPIGHDLQLRQLKNGSNDSNDNNDTKTKNTSNTTTTTTTITTSFQLMENGPIPSIIFRHELIAKLKNTQLIQRMTETINKAITGLQNLKQTYTKDDSTCSRIDMITETISDRIQLVETCLEFLS